MKTRRQQSNRLEWFVMISLLLLSLGCIKCCHGQVLPAVPAYPVPPMQQAQGYIVPKAVRFPYIRYQILGWPVPMQVVKPIGPSFQATVTPVAPVGGPW